MDRAKLNSLKNIISRPVCTVSGFVSDNIGRTGICGKVSVYNDDKGFRCTAHGNTKCEHKKDNKG